MREASDRGAGTLNETDGGRLFALTGATGFLGSHLMAGLIRAGHRVVVLGRSRNGTGLADRVDALLDWFGLESCRERIDAVEVDLLEPRLGLSRRRY
ncbi:MAG TPA: SDR family oxidoreductase, partial [Syntrophorhabdaceae bacterium]|nr:SDR family oxidoreductase [Syntrophorhabdaceae bacterium]